MVSPSNLTLVNELSEHLVEKPVLLSSAVTVDVRSARLQRAHRIRPPLLSRLGIGTVRMQIMLEFSQ